MSESDELKLCPFCGSSARLACHKVSYGDVEVLESYTVECKVCACTIPFRSRDVAVTIWNERK